MKHSVVLPVLINNKQQLSMTMKCIELARSKTSIPFELVIVETGSDYFKEYADVHIYEKNKTNCAISVNRGWKCASGDYITLLTNDVYVEENWLELMLDCFKTQDCGCSTLASTQFNHIKENKIEEANWWCVVMMKREIFNKIGYYDERFMNCWEDTDYLLRMYKEGYKMYRNHNCVVHHLISATIGNSVLGNGQYEFGRKLFNEKHAGCTLPLFYQVR